MAMHLLVRSRVGRTNNVSNAQPSPETILNPVPLVTDTNPPQGRGTILLVEDETFLRDATCEILESTGYRVLKTRNAAEAISAFGQYKAIVKLLLTDVVLPGQNGRDLANDLRAICPNLRTIFISGYPENAVTRHGILQDGMFYLPKPFSLQSLTRKVRQVLEHKETENTNGLSSFQVS
jgi:two-component system cell cycle sensor histidine kinase/response regulator CckA